MKFVIVKTYIPSGFINYGLHRYNIWFKIFGTATAELAYEFREFANDQDAAYLLKKKAERIVKTQDKKVEILEIFEI